MGKEYYIPFWEDTGEERSRYFFFCCVFSIINDKFRQFSKVTFEEKKLALNNDIFIGVKFGMKIPELSIKF